MPRKKSSSLKENLKKKIPEASGADTATDVEMEELSEHEAETSPKDVQPDIRSPKSREQKIREKNFEVKRKARENEERRERERAQDAELRKQAREEDKAIRQRDREATAKTMENLRADKERRLRERARDADLRKQAREEDEAIRQRNREASSRAKENLRADKERREKERARETELRKQARQRPRDPMPRDSNHDAMEVDGEPLDGNEGTAADVPMEVDDDSEPTPADVLRDLRRDHFQHLDHNDFDTDLFSDNPLLNAGKEFYKELEQTGWSTCVHCSETYICMKVGPRSKKCVSCTRNPKLFAPENDLTPSPPPPCLSDLSPIEKSCISLICPVIGIYKKGHLTPSASSRTSTPWPQPFLGFPPVGAFHHHQRSQ